MSSLRGFPAPIVKAMEVHSDVSHWETDAVHFWLLRRPEKRVRCLIGVVKATPLLRESLQDMLASLEDENNLPSDNIPLLSIWDLREARGVSIDAVPALLSTYNEIKRITAGRRLASSILVHTQSNTACILRLLLQLSPPDAPVYTHEFVANIFGECIFRSYLASADIVRTLSSIFREPLAHSVYDSHNTL